jgi:glycerophosphoryl diester phosphodiesterase
MSSEKFEIIVHRAHNELAPENSLAGIREIRALSEDLMIEVDICITADDVPVLYHDLSLDRLCGDPRLLMETAFGDLPLRMDGDRIARLDEMLAAFPGQRFLLDVRTHVHEDFLRESDAAGNHTPPLVRIVPAVQKLLRAEDAGKIRIVVGNPEHRIHARQYFPDFEIDIPEQYTRTLLTNLPEPADATVIGEDVTRMYVRFREISQELISWAHLAGLKIIANHAPSRRSISTSQMMLEQCLDWGMDGLTASPIDRKFIATWEQAIR